MQIANRQREVHRPEQRFTAQKPNPAWDLEEVRDALDGEALILDGGPHPDVGRSLPAPRGEPSDEMRALCQQQPVEVRCAFDQLPQPLARGAQAVSPLEHVGHRRAEDPRAPSGTGRSAVPALRLLPGRLAQEAPRRFGAPYVVTRAFCPSLGVAVVAGRRHFRATPPRIERVIGPFDRRVFCHDSPRGRCEPYTPQSA